MLVHIVIEFTKEMFRIVGIYKNYEDAMKVAEGTRLSNGNWVNIITRKVR